MIELGLLDWIVISMFAGFCVIDAVKKARSFPTMPLWKVRGVLAFVTYFFLAGYSPFLWDGWLGERTFIDASLLPFWAAAAVGFLVFQLGIYVWHRTMHNVPALWRFFHQMHHSAERIDIYSAFYFHPLDMIAFTFVGSLMLVGLVGISPEPAALVNIAATFCSMFQHSNIKTPQWLGYFVTRPESHSVHHQRGLHYYNYGDVPYFDILFGTFRNPKVFEEEAGFYDGASNRIGEMLIGRLVDEEPVDKGRREAPALSD